MMTAAELERSLREKNDLRRASGLPLYDVEKELARFHADQQAAAYAAFVWNDCLSLNSCAARSGRLPLAMGISHIGSLFRGGVKYVEARLDRRVRILHRRACARPDTSPRLNSRPSRHLEG